MTESNNTNVKICRYCGKNIKEEEIICGSCGFNTKTNTLSPQAADKPRKNAKTENEAGKKSVVRVIMSFFGIVVIISLALLLFFTKGGDTLNSLVQGVLPNFNKSKQHSRIENKSSHSTKIMESLGILKKVFQEKKRAKEKNDEIFYVDGILFDTHGKSFATINEKVLSEGESIRNIKIIKISKDSVEVIVDGKNKILKVSQSIPFPKE